MNETMKIYWKLYEELYPNHLILKNFTNLLDKYHSNNYGSIIDIGCGQSSYLIDFYKNRNHSLYAIDTEQSQVDALKRRLQDVSSISNISYSTNKFPTVEFSKVIFSGVIMSNLLHFLNKTETKNLITKVENQIVKGSILLITVHSWKHKSNGDFSYFKRFFKKNDLYELFPRNKYEYLYYSRVSSLIDNETIIFFEKWLELVASQNGIKDKPHISRMKTEYLKKNNTNEYITMVLKRK